MQAMNSQPIMRKGLTDGTVSPASEDRSVAALSIVYEDFPFDSYRHLEFRLEEAQQNGIVASGPNPTVGIIHDIRWKIMIEASARARQDSGSRPVYRVERHHVDKAFSALLTDLTETHPIVRNP